MMQPLRVLYLTDNPNLGASARTLLDWITQQRTANLEFYVGLAQDGPLAGWLRERGVPFIVCDMPWPDWRRSGRYLKSAGGLAAAAWRWRIDVVHAEHNVYPFAAPMARVLRCPIICHVHYLVDRGYAEWAFSGWRRPDHVLWTSHAQMAECREGVKGIVPDARQSVIYLGVNLETFGTHVSREAVRNQWSVSPGTLVVGSANALRPRKRVGDFLHLIDMVTSTRTDVIGVLAGSAPPGDEAYEEEMRRLYAQLSLDKRLLWLGNLDVIEPFMHAIDVFVSTSAHETFGMSICEAMACGKPVVAYQGGSAGEVVGDAGLVVATGDQAGLISAVERLVSSDNLRQSLGRAARTRVAAAFNPKDSLAQLERLYRSLSSR